MPIDFGGMPNLAVAPQVPPFNPLGAQQQQATLSQMLNANTLQKQLAPLQVQEQAGRVEQINTQNQIQQMELASQQAMVKAWSDPDFTKKITGDNTNAESSGLGFDPDAMTKELVTRGVMPKDALALTEAFIKRSQTVAETLKAGAQGGEAQAAMAEKQYKVLADKVGAILDAPAAKAGPMLDALKQDLVKNRKAYSALPQEDLAHIFGANLEQLAAMASMAGLDAKIADFHKSKAEATKAEQGVIPVGGGMSPEAQQGVQKDVAVATNPQVQAAKVAEATATEVAKQKALAPELQQIASTMRSGRAYIDRENIPKGSEGVVEQQAAAAGIPVVSKEVASAMSDIDTAKGNIESMLGIVQGKLATSASERIYKGPENKLQAAMQTDKDLAAMGTFRNAAIQLMRSVAGSKGLRVNIAEINMAIDNDIPKMTDTWDVANAKVNTLLKFLDNTEQANLVRNRAVGGAESSTTTRIRASDGSLHDIPTANLDAAKKIDPKLQVMKQ